MLNVINELKLTTSTREKQNILKKHSNQTLKKLLKYTYDKSYTFNIKQLPAPSSHSPKYNISYAIDEIVNFLIIKQIRGYKAQEYLKRIFESVTKEDFEVLKLILQKDLKCGINKKLINKVFPNLIYEPKYMGAIPYNEKKLDKLLQKCDYVYSQEKLDGEYIALIKIYGSVKTETRNGKDANIEHLFKEALKEFNNIVISGELLVKDFNRYLANGALNSYRTIIQKKKQNKNVTKDIQNFMKRYNISLGEFEKKIYLVAWDILDYNEYINEDARIYEERFKKLDNVICNKIQKVDCRIVKTKEEIFKHFKEVISKGGEGTIVKSPHIGFKNKKLNEIIKIKPQFTIDMKIVDLLYGNSGTKYEKVINKIQTESEDGLVKAQVAGLKEADMEYFTKQRDELVGKIVEVKASFLSRDKDGNYGLLHPSFVKLREDKNIADTLEDIKRNAIMAENLNKFI